MCTVKIKQVEPESPSLLCTFECNPFVTSVHNHFLCPNHYIKNPIIDFTVLGIEEELE